MKEEQKYNGSKTRNYFTAYLLASIRGKRLSNMVLASIKIVCTYQFSIYIIISDETTEKIYYLMDCLLFLLRICYPLISHQNLMM